MQSNQEFSMDNAVVTAKLADANSTHLKFLESWAVSISSATLLGVNILQCMNYENIQVLNNRFLAGFLAPEEQTEQPEGGAE